MGVRAGIPVSNDEFHWRMARNVAQGNDLGDIGNPDGTEVAMNLDTDHADYNTVYGFLELYRATDRGDYLDMANHVGENIVAERFHEPSGLFLTKDDKRIALVGTHLPLALLHLETANQGIDRLPYPGLAAYGAGTSANGGI